MNIEIPFGIILLVIAGIRIRKEPRCFSNAILLSQGIYSVLRGLVILWRRYIPGLNPDNELTLSGELQAQLYFLYLIFFIVMGIFLIISGIRLLRKERLNLTHLLPLAFGFFSLAVVALSLINLFHVVTTSAVTEYILKSLEGFLLSSSLFIPYMVISYFLYSFVYTLVRDRKKPDYIIVLGASLSNDRVSPLLAARLDKGMELYHKYGKQSIFVVSGGKGSDEVCSEADAMARYLREQGIPENRILLEDRSVNTMQNLTFSRQIIEKNTSSEYHCAVVTNNFHMLRGATFSRAAGLSASSYGCRTAAYYYPAAALRECLAFIFSYKAFDVCAILFFFVVNFSTLLYQLLS